MSDLSDYIAKQVEQNPIEAKILKKIRKALKNAHDPIIRVNDDDGDSTQVDSLEELNRAVFNLDAAFLETASGRWILFVVGNEWDCISDYVVSLESALKPVNDYVEKFSD